MLPADVTNDPLQWRLGMPVERTAADVAAELMETSIVAESPEGEQAGVAESPSRKYRKVDAEAKRWFLEFASLKKMLYGWDMVRSLRGAQKLAAPPAS